jgi:hypothetical protein
MEGSMTRRLIVMLCIVAGLAVGLTVVRSASAQGQAAPVCTMPQDVGYSAGALQEYQGQIYQCVYVFGENLTPRGVAWIKVSRMSTFVPQVK